MFVAQNWLRTHLYVWHDSVICHIFNMTHLYVCRAELTEYSVWKLDWGFISQDHVDLDSCMTRSWVWHDPITCVTGLSPVCDKTQSHVWQDSFLCVTRLIRMCDMTYSYVWHDTFTLVTRLNYTWNKTQSCVWHDSLMYVTWLICICDMTDQPFVNRLEFMLGIHHNVTPAKNGRLPSIYGFSYSEN